MIDKLRAKLSKRAWRTVEAIEGIDLVKASKPFRWLSHWLFPDGVPVGFDYTGTITYSGPMPSPDIIRKGVDLNISGYYGSDKEYRAKSFVPGEKVQFVVVEDIKPTEDNDVN